MLSLGADSAHTKTGFDERTGGQGLLIIETTEGFAYAIAKENGEILTEKEKIFWSVTADTDDIDKGMTVTVNEWGFYAAPAIGNQIRFRVPPGGKYYRVTRLDDGTVVRSELLQVPSTGKNITISDNPQRGRPKTLIKIDPVSGFAEYATVDKRTGQVNDFVPAPKGLYYASKPIFPRIKWASRRVRVLSRRTADGYCYVTASRVYRCANSDLTACTSKRSSPYRKRDYSDKYRRGSGICAVCPWYGKHRICMAKASER